MAPVPRTSFLLILSRGNNELTFILQHSWGCLSSFTKIKDAQSSKTFLFYFNSFVDAWNLEKRAKTWNKSWRHAPFLLFT